MILKSSKYLKTSFVYALSISFTSGIRASLIFILSLIFSFNDSSKFFLYTAFTIASDLSSLFGSYLGVKFLGKRISCIIGFCFLIFGNFFLFLSVLNESLFFFYSSLTYISLGTGILKCNLFMISNAYLNKEFSQNKNDYGSLLHTLTVFSSFVMIFLSGSLIKNYTLFIPIFYSFLLLLAFSFFIFFEKSTIKISLMKLKETFQNASRANVCMFFLLIFLTHFAIFLFLKFNELIYLRHTPIIFFASFYIYLFIRASKHAEEKRAIFLSIFFGIFLIFYISLERQRDTSFALFLSRNVDLNFLNLNLSPLQINSLFSIFILSIGTLFFKFKIHSKLSHKKVFLCVNFIILISFGALYFGTKIAIFQNLSSMNLFYYIFSMFLMSICNVLVYTKFIEICRIMPTSIKSIISSFMIINVAAGFYIARFYNEFMAINYKISNNFDKLSSLQIYSNGFLKIIIICSIFFALLIFTFFSKKVSEILKLN